MRNKIVVYVEGGVVQAVRAFKPDDIDVLIFDVDNLKEDKTGAEILKLWQDIEADTKSIDYV